ncbi:MAG: hypothetical protein U0235_28455 [Polyangiaceae bacterium]
MSQRLTTLATARSANAHPNPSGAARGAGDKAKTTVAANVETSATP